MWDHRQKTAQATSHMSSTHYLHSHTPPQAIFTHHNRCSLGLQPKVPDNFVWIHNGMFKIVTPRGKRHCPDLFCHSQQALVKRAIDILHRHLGTVNICPQTLLMSNVKHCENWSILKHLFLIPETKQQKNSKAQPRDMSETLWSLDATLKCDLFKIIGMLWREDI